MLIRTGAAEPWHGANTASLIRQLLTESPFHGRRTIAALPSETVHLRTVRVPQEEHLGIEAAVREEAAGLFPFELGDASVRLILAGSVRCEGKPWHEVIVAAARHDELRRFVQVLRDAGLHPESLQLQPMALFAAATRVTREHVTALLEIGGVRSTMMIGRGGRLTFLKHIPLGSAQLRDAIARKLGLRPEEVIPLLHRHGPIDGSTSDARRDPVAVAAFDATRGLIDELATQVSRCLRYHAITFRGEQPARLEIIGAESADPHLPAALSTALAMPAGSLDLLQGVDPSALGALSGTMPPITLSTTALALSLPHNDQSLAAPSLPRAAAA